MSSPGVYPATHNIRIKEEKFSNFSGFTSTQLQNKIQKEVVDFAVNTVMGSSSCTNLQIPPQINQSQEVESTIATNLIIPVGPVISKVQSKSGVSKSKQKDKKPVKVKSNSAGTSLSGKKRLKKPETWKKNVSKVKKIKGEAHLSRNGTFIPAKLVEKIDCSSCMFNCNDNYSEDLRNQLFNMFYSLGSNESQKQFVCQNVTEETTKQSDKKTEDGEPVENKRKVSRRYFLPEDDNNRQQVCSRFFRGTLCIGKSFITHALKHKQFGCYMGQEKRGKPHNKTPTDQIDVARNHIIEVLDLDAGKGVKKKSAKKRVLEKGLTVVRMYQMFKLDCEGKKQVPVSLSIYRRIFHTEF